jgi:hypothetical protein
MWDDENAGYKIWTATHEVRAPNLTGFSPVYDITACLDGIAIPRL